MAFGIQYLGRLSYSQNLDKTYNTIDGNVATPLPTVWVYNASANYANNSKAQVLAADYFLSVYAYLSVGDLIYAYCNNGNALMTVTTSAAGGLTTTVLAQN